MMKTDKKYMVVCYMRIAPEDTESDMLTYEQAMKELDHCRYLQPENMYQIESIDPDELEFCNEEPDYVV